MCNNLVAERNRREKAEEALQSTRLNLRTVAQDLTPQVQQLTQAVEALQVEKRRRLQQDEAKEKMVNSSLKNLQDLIDAVGARQEQFCAVDCRIENNVKQLEEQTTADRYDLRRFISRLQEVQDEHTAEIQLLHQEMIASKTFVTQRLNAIEDAVTSVRSEIARGVDQQHTVTLKHSAKMDELDEKLFALDKELLKLKLALPASVKAQLPTSFTDQSSTCGIRTSTIHVEAGDLSIALKLQEAAADLEAVKADALAYRSADRKQFDAITNRMREAAKSQHDLKKEVEGRLQDARECYDQMMIKIPSELSKRLQKAHAAWSSEIEGLKATVLNLEAFYNVQKRKVTVNTHHDCHADPEQLKTFNKLQKEVASLREEHGSHLARIDKDLLGLYDWTRGKMAAISNNPRPL
ncbi:hypothetical protein P3T76_014583 [Phytophthora citrophthora]|uniref:Uncharacterized protein n=1 Tax=Phytophthora citrophthora TaxID=4793 RepID=A0AAD9G1J6_9STRA|nr:hypothetical protein P3T76_014583 [Phytophthora citrophthora]